VPLLEALTSSLDVFEFYHIDKQVRVPLSTLEVNALGQHRGLRVLKFDLAAQVSYDGLLGLEHLEKVEVSGDTSVAAQDPHLVLNFLTKVHVRDLSVSVPDLAFTPNASVRFLTFSVFQFRLAPMNEPLYLESLQGLDVSRCFGPLSPRFSPMNLAFLKLRLNLRSLGIPLRGSAEDQQKLISFVMSLRQLEFLHLSGQGQRINCLFNGERVDASHNLKALQLTRLTVTRINFGQLPELEHLVLKQCCLRDVLKVVRGFFEKTGKTLDLLRGCGRRDGDLYTFDDVIVISASTWCTLKADQEDVWRHLKPKLLVDDDDADNDLQKRTFVIDLTDDSCDDLNDDEGKEEALNTQLYGEALILAEPTQTLRFSDSQRDPDQTQKVDFSQQVDDTFASPDFSQLD
jgi:hypothetical protein